MSDDDFKDVMRETVEKSMAVGAELMRQAIISRLLRETDLTDATRFWLIEKIKEVPLP